MNTKGTLRISFLRHIFCRVPLPTLEASSPLKRDARRQKVRIVFAPLLIPSSVTPDVVKTRRAADFVQQRQLRRA